MDEKAFYQYRAVLHNSLDVQAVLPFLIKHRLLTQCDKDKLKNPYVPNSEKVNYLMEMLPREADHWLDDFIQCLEESSEGTGHSKIVKELRHAKQLEPQETKKGYYKHSV